MIEILPNALYTRADLAQILDGSGVDVDTFLGRIKSRKVFKSLWLGSDLLEAVRAAPALADRSDSANVPIRRKRITRGVRGRFCIGEKRESEPDALLRRELARLNENRR
jgi:hypothetical protein